ncbi:MAG: hypothetical protein HC907_35805 [Richelia sp. SM1_7_0]|nr:hypothetical protein [Richelia sp. SM1_7_0]
MSWQSQLQQVFGAGATQDASTLIIDKADFAAVGLTADTSNTAEALLIAIILTAQSSLTEANFETNLEQSIYVETGLPSFRTRNTTQYRTDSLAITLAKLDTAGQIDPDDY